MRCVTVRIRSVVWFFTGAFVAAVMAVMFLHAWRVDATSSSESTFVPVTPCRLLDTRPPGGIPFTAGETRTLDAHGSNGACTLPVDAVGLSMNVTALDATVVGTYLTIWPDGVAMPNASSLNPSPGQPPFPNAVTTPLSAAGRFNVFNFTGGVNVIIDVNGYYTTTTMQDVDQRLADLAAANAALQGRVQSLETTLANVEALTVDGKPTVRFTGVNVQIVDGTGDTECSGLLTEDCNGLGNLIIGYNEDLLTQWDRTGSHNLVIGPENDWTSHAGFVTGRWNKISGEYASVAGGVDNTASGEHSSVSGGMSNTASDRLASVSGGYYNTASGPASSVSGGVNNTASGSESSVSGGSDNIASGSESSVSGGSDNIASGWLSSVSGGYNNTAAADHNSVPGGDDIYCNAVGQAAACGEGAIVSPD